MAHNVSETPHKVPKFMSKDEIIKRIKEVQESTGKKDQNSDNSEQKP